MPLDFSGRDLRGRSFAGQDLTKANFSYADIRGTNFTNANLKEADFTNAESGLQTWWSVILIITSLLLAILLGLIAESCCTGLLAGLFQSLIFNLARIIGTDLRPLHQRNMPFTSDDFYQGLYGSLTELQDYIGMFSLMFFPTILLCSVRYGLGKSLRRAALIGIPVLLLAFVYLSIFSNYYLIGAWISAWFTTVAWVLSITGVAILATVLTLISGRKWFMSVSSVAASLAILLADLAFVFLVRWKNAGYSTLNSLEATDYAYIFTGVLNGLLMLFSIRISWKALNSKEGFNFIYDLSVYFASLRGTSFYKADLTEANFSKATLQSANFEEANLSKVFWA